MMGVSESGEGARKPMRVRIAAVTLLALVGAGCARTSPDVPAQLPTSASESSPASVSVSPPPRPATFRNPPVPARDDVRLTTCTTDAGEQTVRGIVTNSSDEIRDYAIVVMWLRNDAGTPYGSTLITVHDVIPGARRRSSVIGNSRCGVSGTGI